MRPGRPVRSNTVKADVPGRATRTSSSRSGVEGNRRVEPEVIKRALKNKVGRPFDPALTGADVQSLWSLGLLPGHPAAHPAAARRGHRLRGPGGGAPVGPRSWRLQGNEELSKDDFKDVIDLKPYPILDLDAVQRNVKKIQEKYVEKGFFLAEVTYKIVPVQGDEPGRRGVRRSTSTPRSW